MATRVTMIAAPLIAAALTGSACAMTASSPHRIECRVIGGDKLPAETGGPEALCAAIRRAAASSGPASRFSVEVRVLGNASLAATLKTATGKVLPEQRFSISDSSLTRSAIDRFARALVGAVAGTH